MSPGQRVRGRWLAGYVLVLLGTLPIAQPIWTGWLRERIGRFVSLEAIHVVQYVGAGWLGAWYSASGLSRGQRIRLWGSLVGLGWVDEAIQGWLPQRFFEWSDVGWNWVGLAVGALGGLLVVRGRRRHLQRSP